MKSAIPALLVVVSLLSQVPASRAIRPPTAATDVTNIEVLTVLKLARLDQQIKVVDVGAYNVAVGVLHRGAPRPGSPPATRVSAFSHDQVTEVYYIISGAGTLVTGGRLVDAKPADLGELVGPSRGGFVEGGRSRQVTRGDVVIIPHGVPHGFSVIADHLDYLSIRIDAEHVLPAGYVHQAIRNSAGHREDQS